MLGAERVSAYKKTIDFARKFLLIRSSGDSPESTIRSRESVILGTVPVASRPYGPVTGQSHGLESHGLNPPVCVDLPIIFF